MDAATNGCAPYWSQSTGRRQSQLALAPDAETEPETMPMSQSAPNRYTTVLEDRSFGESRLSSVKSEGESQPEAAPAEPRKRRKLHQLRTS